MQMGSRIYQSLVAIGEYLTWKKRYGMRRNMYALAEVGDLETILELKKEYSIMGDWYISIREKSHPQWDTTTTDGQIY